MRARDPFAYVVGVDGSRVVLNMHASSRGQVAAHAEGIASIGQPGDLFAVDGGPRKLILRLEALLFDEPREAHREGVGTDSVRRDPLRRMEATVVGSLRAENGRLRFANDSLHMPALGAGAFALSEDEAEEVMAPASGGMTLDLGREARSGARVRVPLGATLARHMAVVGASGFGKSCYVTFLVRQMLAAGPRARVIVFDINGEYWDALSDIQGAAKVAVGPGGLRIPYYALGRQGLGRLLLPSEKTQRPALTFALENLNRIECRGDGARLPGGAADVLFDDCRPEDAKAAQQAIKELRAGHVQLATVWPHMRGLSALVADGYAIKTDSKGTIRDAFNYGHVAPLVNRINRFIDDEQFNRVVDVRGGAPAAGSAELCHTREGDALIESLFGSGGDPEVRVRVVDLSGLSHDLMPFVLGSVLELLASTLFRRGPGRTHPLVLVLEEAHHYLRQLPSDAESGMHSLAYERLAKEGRKFGLSLLLSTQRPSEISPTVLSQCGTWAVFRLTNEADLKALSFASEWSSRRLVEQVPGLGRQQALVFGAGLRLAARVTVPTVSPGPKSADPAFDSAWATESAPATSA